MIAYNKWPWHTPWYVRCSLSGWFHIFTNCFLGFRSGFYLLRMFLYFRCPHVYQCCKSNCDIACELKSCGLCLDLKIWDVHQMLLFLLSSSLTYRTYHNRIHDYIHQSAACYLTPLLCSFLRTSNNCQTPTFPCKYIYIYREMYIYICICKGIMSSGVVLQKLNVEDC